MGRDCWARRTLLRDRRQPGTRRNLHASSRGRCRSGSVHISRASPICLRLSKRPLQIRRPAIPLERGNPFRWDVAEPLAVGEGFRLTPSGQPSLEAGKAAAPVHGRIHRIGRNHDCLRESEHSSLKISRIPTAFFGKSRGICISRSSSRENACFASEEPALYALRFSRRAP
jgi:hypothetical protein